jgi:hypothetical protein
MDVGSRSDFLFPRSPSRRAMFSQSPRVAFSAALEPQQRALSSCKEFRERFNRVTAARVSILIQLTRAPR